MSVTKEQIEDAIKAYIEPHLEKDLISTKSVKDISIDGTTVNIKINMGFPLAGFKDQLENEIKTPIISTK